MSIQNVSRLLALAACSLVAFGCASSLVYSPAIKLPSRPLHMNQGEAIASVCLLPETRPVESPHNAEAGGDITLRYAFSDRITLGANYWASISDLADNQFRGGLGLEAIVALSDDHDAMRFGLMPRGQALFDGSAIDGWGIAVPVAMWFPRAGSFTTYAAAGPAFGFRDLSATPGQWGYGLIMNLGSAIELGDSFRANVELAGVIAVNRYDGITNGIFAPSAGIAWKF